MKKAVFTMVLLFIVAELLTARNDADKIKSDIDTLMTSWHRAAATADAKTYFDLMAPGAIFLGTDASERWTKDEFQQYAAPSFRRESAWVYVATRRNIFLSADQTFAWLDEELASKSYWTCRGTAVLEKIDGHWKIQHYNLMFTVPNSAVKDIKPIVERELAKTAHR
jgi:ketosteroid isomerase-like protein